MDPAEDFIAGQGVAPDLFPFRLAERALLAQHRVVDPDFPDIVQMRRYVDEGGVLVQKIQAVTEQLGHPRHAHRVAGRVDVPRFQCGDDSDDQVVAEQQFFSVAHFEAPFVCKPLAS